jgi:thioredoxin 1
MKTVLVTDHTLEEVVKSNKVVLVDFWAPWCGPCRMIAPILDQLAIDLHQQAVIAKLNVDENPYASAKYQIQGIPTMKLFVRGAVVDTIVGLQPIQNIKSAILKHTHA